MRKRKSKSYNTITNQIGEKSCFRRTPKPQPIFDVVVEEISLVRKARTDLEFSAKARNIYKKVPRNCTDNTTSYYIHTMARQRSKKIVEGRKANPEAAKPQNPVRDDSEFSDNDSDSDDIMEDDDENELARMVLGDSAGFDAKLGEDYEEESEEDGNVLGNENDGEDQDLEGVDDADVSGYG